MKNRAFTLIELIVVCVVVAILATLALPAYQNVVESSKQKVCDTNLLTIQKAVEMYTMEHDTVPGSLSELDNKYIQKAYASVMSGKGAWQRRLAYFLVEGPQWGIAYAQGFGMPHLRCPSNPDTSPTAISYGLNGGIAGISSLAYKNLADTVVVAADSGANIFSYPGAGGPDYSGDSSKVIPFTEIIGSRGHKKYQVLSQSESSLRGVTKNGQKGRFTSANTFYPESSH
jgi:prepilin-type N-terminal cleavage/methylation domain-containing protein